MSLNARAAPHYQTALDPLASPSLSSPPPFPDPGCLCTAPALSRCQCQGYYSWSDCPKASDDWLPTYLLLPDKECQMKKKKIQKWRKSWSRNSRSCCPEHTGIWFCLAHGQSLQREETPGRQSSLPEPWLLSTWRRKDVITKVFTQDAVFCGRQGIPRLLFSLPHAYSPFHVFPLVSAQRWDFRFS